MEALHEAGCNFWTLAMARELDDALCQLRFNYETVGLLILKTAGDPERVLAFDRALARLADNWLAREIILKLRRTLKRLDLTARSLFALLEPGSCFAGSLLELALAADRSYMLDGAELPGHDRSRTFERRTPANEYWTLSLGNPVLGRTTGVERTLEHKELFDAEEAEEYGLVTFTPDELDWDDEIVSRSRKERVSRRDAMTGMEASLRFPGPETMETKIFGRLTAWQNWIFQRPNAVGEKGALTFIRSHSLPEFDWRRT